MVWGTGTCFWAKKMKKLLDWKREETAEKASERRKYFTHERDFKRGNTICRIIKVMAERFGEEQVSWLQDVWLKHKLKLHLTELYNNHKYLSFSLLCWGTSEEFWIRESQVSVVLGSERWFEHRERSPVRLLQWS